MLLQSCAANGATSLEAGFISYESKFMVDRFIRLMGVVGLSSWCTATTGGKEPASVLGQDPPTYVLKPARRLTHPARRLLEWAGRPSGATIRPGKTVSC